MRIAHEGGRGVRPPKAVLILVEKRVVLTSYQASVSLAALVKFEWWNSVMQAPFSALA